MKAKNIKVNTLVKMEQLPKALKNHQAQLLQTRFSMSNLIHGF